jgi:hypothetical protein
MLHNRDTFENELIVVTKVKNEAPYIKEWIEYHQLVGVEKFIIYDNESDDNLKELLQPYIDSGEVIYRFQPGYFLLFERKVISDAVKEYRNKSKWIAVIDADEFIVPIKKDKITTIIDELEKHLHKKIHGLAVSWVMYGYSGHYKRPEGLVIENYMKSDGIDKHIKSIVNPRTVIRYDIHHAFHFFLLPAINERGKTVKDGAIHDMSNASIEQIRINHYYTKSYEDWTSKEVRNNKLNKEEYIPPVFDPDFFSHKEDRIMDKYIPLLKDKMNEKMEKCAL